MPFVQSVLKIFPDLTGIISDTHMVYSYKSDKVCIRSIESVPWTLDGEFGGEHWDVEITNLKQKVNIVVS